MHNKLLIIIITLTLSNNLLAELSESKAIELGSKTADIAIKGVVSELENAIKNNGPKEAVKFCNENLPSIMTKIKAEVGENLKIQRKTDKTRNPKNLADDIDRAALDYFKNDFTKQKTNFIKETENNYIYFQPIYIKPTCLICHGKNIEKSLDQEIKKLYPNDQATGYELGDLRAVIRIELQK
jgi:hypothetical protein